MMASPHIPISQMNCIDKAKKNSILNIGTNRTSNATRTNLFSLLSIGRIKVEFLIKFFVYFCTVKDIIFFSAHFFPIICIEYLARVIISQHCIIKVKRWYIDWLFWFWWPRYECRRWRLPIQFFEMVMTFTRRLGLHSHGTIVHCW